MPWSPGRAAPVCATPSGPLPSAGGRTPQAAGRCAGARRSSVRCVTVRPARGPWAAGAGGEPGRSSLGGLAAAAAPARPAGQGGLCVCSLEKMKSLFRPFAHSFLLNCLFLTDFRHLCVSRVCALSAAPHPGSLLPGLWGLRPPRPDGCRGCPGSGASPPCVRGGPRVLPPHGVRWSRASAGKLVPSLSASACLGLLLFPLSGTGFVTGPPGCLPSSSRAFFTPDLWVFCELKNWCVRFRERKPGRRLMAPAPCLRGSPAPETGPVCVCVRVCVCVCVCARGDRVGLWVLPGARGRVRVGEDGRSGRGAARTRCLGHGRERMRLG